MIDYKRLEKIKYDMWEGLNQIRNYVDTMTDCMDDFDERYMSETDDALNTCINLGLVPGVKIVLNDGTRYVFIGYCLGGSRLKFQNENGDNRYMMCQNQVEAHKRGLWHFEHKEANNEH